MRRDSVIQWRNQLSVIHQHHPSTDEDCDQFQANPDWVSRCKPSSFCHFWLWLSTASSAMRDALLPWVHWIIFIARDEGTRNSRFHANGDNSGKVIWTGGEQLCDSKFDSYTTFSGCRTISELLRFKSWDLEPWSILPPLFTIRIMKI